MASILLLALIGLDASAPVARACGGFFCNLSQPVDQQDEEIVFVAHGDGTTTMAVRVFYAGPAEQFAWLLPVQGVPDVGVSSNKAFDRLRRATDPQYVLREQREGVCMEWDDFGADAGSAVATDGSTRDATPKVTVLSQGAVGPFEYSTISVDGGAEDAADVAVDWLTTNGYDVTGVGADVLRPYLADGLNLIAFKLAKGTSTGSIRPIVLQLPGERPSIPIRPTAVAARPDMGVVVWVLGDARAIPLNYKSLVLNEARIDWFAFRSNYDEVISAAADEAGGQGFVTELAGDSAVLEGRVYSASEDQRWRGFTRQAFETGLDALAEARARYFDSDTFRDVVCDSLTLAEGYTCDDWASADNDQSTDTRGSVTATPDEVRDLVFEHIVEPLQEMQELLASRPYVTRLYTTLSPPEMTLDPVFAFNAELPDVSNVHEADLIIECDPALFPWEAPYRVVLPSGDVVTGEAQRWPAGLSTTPANATISQLSTEGQGVVVQDNREAIAAWFGDDTDDVSGGGAPRSDGEMDAGVAANEDGDDTGGGADTSGDDAATNGGDGGLCGVAAPGRGEGGAGAAWLVMLLALSPLLRRRARSRSERTARARRQGHAQPLQDRSSPARRRASRARARA
jgi:hypothetical protein